MSDDYLPIAEAMKCGCPVIACNSSSIPEVGGDAIIYVQPNDVEDLVEKIRVVEHGQIDTLAMAYRGYQQAKKFQWEVTSIQFHHFFEEVLIQK